MADYLKVILMRLLRVFCAAALAGLCIRPLTSPADSTQQTPDGVFHELSVGDIKLRLPTTIEFEVYRKDRDAPLGKKVFRGEQTITDPVPLDSVAIDLDQVVPKATHGGLIYMETTPNALFADTYCKYLARARLDKNLERANDGEVVRIPNGELFEMYVVGGSAFIGRPAVLLSDSQHFFDVSGVDFGRTYYALAAVRRDVLITLHFYAIDVPQNDWGATFALLNEKLGSWLIEPSTTFETSTGGSHLSCLS